MIILEFAVGALAGVLSGFGIGGGTLLILWLTLAAGMDQLHAGGINLLYFSFPAIPALIGHMKNQLIKKKAAVFCIIAGVPTCILASIFAGNIDVGWLRRAFGILLLYIGIKELFSKPPAKKKENSKAKDKRANG